MHPMCGVSLSLIAWCVPTLCHGAQLTDADLAAGRQPAIGDTVVLRDFARCFPKGACAPTSVKGKWWQRAYTTPGGQQERLLVE